MELLFYFKSGYLWFDNPQSTLVESTVLWLYTCVQNTYALYFRGF